MGQVSAANQKRETEELEDRASMDSSDSGGHQTDPHWKYETSANSLLLCISSTVITPYLLLSCTVALSGRPAAMQDRYIDGHPMYHPLLSPSVIHGKDTMQEMHAID